MKAAGTILFHATMIGLMAGPLGSIAHADDTKLWSTAGVWDVYKQDDNCYAAAGIGEYSAIALMINNQHKIAGIYAMLDTLGASDGAYSGFSWHVAAAATTGSTVITHKDKTTIYLSTYMNESFLSQLAKSDTVTIAHHYVDEETEDEGDETLDTINLPDVDGAVSELHRCWKELISEDLGSGKPVVTKPVLSNPGEIAQYTDYPTEALRNGEFGRAVVTLTVSAHGVPSACTLKESSGSVALDSATCKTFLDHAQFTPAKDANGDTTQGSYERAITWKLPT